MTELAPDPFDLAARRFELSGASGYLYDPVGFVNKFIRFGPTEKLAPYQLEALAQIPIKGRVSVRGPHGLGKTTIKALAVLWFAYTREANRIDWKCVTTAGAWRQLINYLWPEIYKWLDRIDWELLEASEPTAGQERLNLSLKLRYGSAFAVASSKKELIEGAHADSILYIFDESKAIPAPIWEAAEGAFAGAKLPGQGLPEAFALASSTPGDPAGVFYAIQTNKPGYEDWWSRHVRVTEAIAGGRISENWVIQRARQWIGCPQVVDPTHRCSNDCVKPSALFSNRVLGQFHSSDVDSVIPLSWIEQANERWHDWNETGRPMPDGRTVIGVDVARGGGDQTCIAARNGNVVRLVERHNLRDTMAVADLVQFKHLIHLTDLAVIDVIGVGAGVADRIRRDQTKNVIAFNAARSTKRRDRSGQLEFANQRAAMWWLMREMLDPAFYPQLCLPPDDQLSLELSAPKWKLSESGKIQVESKADIRERIGSSTDSADAVCHTLLTDPEFDEFADDSSPAAFQYTDQMADTGFAWKD